MAQARMIQVIQARARDLADWRSHLRDFRLLCEASGPEQQNQRLLEAYNLLRSAHMALRQPSFASLEGHELLRLLSVGAYESAALALLGEDVGIMLSRGTRGICMASVALPGSSGEAHAAADTPALALLAALASALLTARQ